MLLKTINDLRGYVPVSSTLSWEGVSPYIDAAEREYLKPLIGEELYDALESYISGSTDSGSGDDAAKYEQAIYLAKKAMANLGVWEGYHIFSANISDKGARRIESAEHKSLYRYQEEDLKDRLRSTGHNSLDTLLAFLEDNIEYFPEFEETDTYKAMKASIIPDTASFNKIIDIGNSRLVFLRISRFITQAIDLDIKPVLGTALYNEVVTEIQKASPAAKVLSLLPYLQKPLAFLALARGLDEMGYNITDRGILFYKSATNSPTMRKDQAPTQEVFNMARKNEQTGFHYLQIMKQYLITNASTYENFTGFTGPLFKRDNTNKKTVWK